MTATKIKKLLLAGSIAFTPLVTVAQDFNDPQFVAGAMRGFFQFQIAGMVFLIVIAAMALYFATQREKRRQDLMARYLEKGQDVPHALLPAPPSRQHDLRRGIWLLSWGLGIGLVLYIASGDWSVAAWSLILLFLSAASFINAMMLDPNGRSAGGGQ
jgi:hypothetical protein